MLRSLSSWGIPGALALGIVVVAVGVARRGVAALPPATEIPPEVRALAERSLAEMRSAPPELAATFGFPTAGEARQARLGTPIREFVVPLNVLRTYQETTPVAKLWTDGTTWVFPVLVGTALRSAVRLQAPPGAAPRVLGLGGVEALAQLDRLPEVAAQLRKAGTESMLAVRVPALGLYFAGRRAGSTLELASPFDVPNERIQSGVWEKAETVFARLAPSARALPKGAMGPPR